MNFLPKKPRRGLWIVKAGRHPNRVVIARIDHRPAKEAQNIARAVFPEYPKLKLKWWTVTSDENRRDAKWGIPIYGVRSGQIVGYPFRLANQIVSIQTHKAKATPPAL